MPVLNDPVHSIPWQCIFAISMGVCYDLYGLCTEDISYLLYNLPRLVIIFITLAPRSDKRLTEKEEINLSDRPKNFFSLFSKANSVKKHILFRVIYTLE